MTSPQWQGYFGVTGAEPRKMRARGYSARASVPHRSADVPLQRSPDLELAGRIIVRHHHHPSGGSDQIGVHARGPNARTKPGHRIPRSDSAMLMPRTRNEWVTACLIGAPLPPLSPASPATSVVAFRSHTA